MGIFKKAIAMIRYKKGMKKASKQVASFMDIYERNERRLQEVRELISLDTAESMSK